MTGGTRERGRAGFSIVIQACSGSLFWPFCLLLLENYKKDILLKNRYIAVSIKDLTKYKNIWHEKIVP